MALPPDLPSRSPEEVARRIGLSLLDEARAAAERLDDAEDKEALHDFRVAIRRLRSTLRAWRPQLGRSVRKRDLKRLKVLQVATGEGRDAEVALAWLGDQRGGLHTSHRRGLDWLAERLGRRHADAMGHAREGVRAAFESIEADLRPRLGTLRIQLDVDPDDDAALPRFGDALAAKAREHLDRLAQRLLRVTSGEDRAAGHAARIAGKRLRYLLEPVRRDRPRATAIVKRCKELQDLLGDLNDAHVLREELGGALEAAAAERARELHELAQDPDAESVRRAVRRSERPGLVELTRRTQRRIDALYERVDKEWLQGGLDTLCHEVGKLAQELETRDVEVERKFLLHGLPPLPPETPNAEIDQGWLPGERLRERIRRTRFDHEVQYRRTLKFGRGERRTEVEEATSAEVFEALWPLTEGCRVRKRRWRVTDGDHVWEVDEFLDRELVLAEVEFPGGAAPPPPPQWLAPFVVRDVTDEDDYTNLALAR